MRMLLVAFLALAVSSPAMNPVEARLDRQLKFWQKRLGLEDWDIEIHLVRQKQLDRRTWGNAEWDPDRKSAIISVLDPRDYNLKGSSMKMDMECTIVHELVHIQVAPLDARSEQVREDVVNRIMTALVNHPCPN